MLVDNKGEYRHIHQEIVETLVWPDRFDNTKSRWCSMISSYIKLTYVEITAKELLTYIGGYHLDITRPSLAILTKTLSNFINAVPKLGVSYNHLYSACIWMSRWWYLASHHHFGKDCYENRDTHWVSTHHLNKIQKFRCVLLIST